MMTRRLAVVAAFALMALVPSLVQAETQTVGVTEDVPARKFGFNPTEIRIAVGDTIAFVNDGTEEHDVTADGNVFSSPSLPPGATFSFTFTAPGKVTYFCSLHDNQTGVILVGEVAEQAEPAVIAEGG
jgi:plastocyanin